MYSFTLNREHAQPKVLQNWSLSAEVTIERAVWLAAMLPMSKGKNFKNFKKFVECYQEFNINRLEELEAKCEHQTVARIRLFNEEAGVPDSESYVHTGLTSSDVVDTVMNFRIRRSLALTTDTYSRKFIHMAVQAIKMSGDTLYAARTHNVHARAMRLSTFLTNHFGQINNAFSSLAAAETNSLYPKMLGPVGDGAELDLIHPAYRQLTNNIGMSFQFDGAIMTRFQAMPRQTDVSLIAGALEFAAAWNNFAKWVRLAAGHGLVREVPLDDYIGSSAMPHKTNTILAERINSLTSLVKGYISAAMAGMGDEWNCGDVSDSYNRKVWVPGLCKTIDAIAGTGLKMMERLEISADDMNQEVKENWGDLTSSLRLALLIRSGVGRETAHSLVRAGGDTAVLRSAFGLDKADVMIRMAINESERSGLLQHWEELLAEHPETSDVDDNGNDYGLPDFGQIVRTSEENVGSTK